MVSGVPWAEDGGGWLTYTYVGGVRTIATKNWDSIKVKLGFEQHIFEI